MHSIYRHSSIKPKPTDTTIYPQFKHQYERDIHWELPSKSTPLGILLFLHGCNHHGSDLWPRSNHCPRCLGLSEEQRTRKLALKHSLAVVAVSSLQATYHGKGCWNPHLSTDPSKNSADDDLSSVAAILNILVTKDEPQLKNLPIYALGVSSGGTVALFLPKVMKLAGICAQIMAVNPDELEKLILSSSSSTHNNGNAHSTSTQLHQNKFAYPPTMFMHMPRDERTAFYVEKDAAVLQKLNIPVAVMQTAPRPLTTNFLTHHSDGQISYDLAVAIVGDLRHHKLLDVQGMVVKDPRHYREEWVAAVEPVTENFISLESSVSPLSTLMNVAYGWHDIITSGLDSALKWLESGGQGDLVSWLAAEEAEEN